MKIQKRKKNIQEVNHKLSLSQKKAIDIILIIIQKTI